jgi:hypothetical protein
MLPAGRAQPRGWPGRCSSCERVRQNLAGPAVAHIDTSIYENLETLGLEVRDLINLRMLAGESIAYVPFFPLGSVSPLQSSALSTVATRLTIVRPDVGRRRESLPGHPPRWQYGMA